MRSLFLIKQYLSLFISGLVLILSSTGFFGCDSDSDNSSYREHCVATQKCDREYVTDVDLNVCEDSWVRDVNIATSAGCSLEFEHYFECVKSQFSCEYAGQTCPEEYNDYQLCFTGNNQRN